MSRMDDLDDQSWYRILTTDPDESEQELVGLLGSEWHQPPVASRLHFASCDGVSQVNAELNVAGDRTLVFYMNTLDARETLYSLASAAGLPESVLDAIDKATRR